MPPQEPLVSAAQVLLADGEATTNQRVAATLAGDATQLELPPEHRPADGADVLVAVRFVDRDGRPATLSRWRRLRRVGGALHALPAPPLFPLHADWLPRVRGATAEVALLLPARPGLLGYGGVALERCDAGGEVATVCAFATEDLGATVCTSCELAAGEQRFRWRLTTHLEDEVLTPWSAAVKATTVSATFEGVTIGGRTS